jgi:hypothetical protein
MLEGALILLGRFLPGRRRAVARKPPRPVCGCTHHHSFHDPKAGACRATVNGLPVHRNQHGYADAWEQVPCKCQAYSGPLPLPEVYAPEIGG